MADRLRLADLLSALSLATDLGVGAPLETSLRTCLLATSLGHTLGLRGPELSTVYYASMMRHLGCTAWAHEAAALAGDDLAMLRTFEDVDPAHKAAVAGRAIRRLAPEAPLGRRVATVAKVLAQPGAGKRLIAAQCAQAEALALDLSLGPEIALALSQMYERHDGKGAPLGLRGAALAPAGQLVHLAQVLESLHRLRGKGAALEELARRRGRQFSASLCDLARGLDAEVWQELAGPRLWEQVLAAEPAPQRTVSPAQLDEVALAFSRFTDLKSPASIGHSLAVAELCRAAAERAGLPPAERDRLATAALLHDLGAVSVSNAAWDHPGPLGAASWEQVRLHTYWGERILARSPITRPFAALVGGHHERLDGSGYHRNTRGDALDRSARLLAAADAWIALTSRRPHRDARSAEAATKELLRDAAAGQLCREACALVLAAAGQPAPRAAFPAGLTEREAEVLGLVARGLVAKEIAAQLGIATRTVKHHIEHIYEKTGVSTRAAAALFAARNNLVPVAAD